MSNIQTQPIFGKTRQIHMVGIGGIGMSGIAEILLQKGYKVTGSDHKLSATTKRLEELGATIFKGHEAGQIEGADVVVYTSAVTAEENVETKEAMDRKIPVIKRSEMLAELMRMKYGIGIAGTHGKTTTTTLAGLVARQGNFDPTIVVGGRVHSFQETNAVVGTGDIIVVEADEYDRTFLRLTPSLAVITNIDMEHMDIYKDESDIKRAFVTFANKVPFYGAVILCLDDPLVRSIIPSIDRRMITYGTTPQASLRAVDIETNGFNTTFNAIYNRKVLGQVTLRSPGEHNVKNALAAMAVGLELNMKAEAIIKGIEEFDGVFRRFQKKDEINDILVIDDYAHHPTEVKATLSAARKAWPKRRLVAVFQPHLYSRTQQLYEEFGISFFDAEVTVITDIYPAREKPIEGVTGKLIADTAEKFGHQDMHYVTDKNDLPDKLNTLTEPGDIVITMGAGDIYKYGEVFIKTLKKQLNN